jgi:hypothetical protein
MGSAFRLVVTLAAAATFSAGAAGCLFPQGTSDGGADGGYGFSAPTLEVTVAGAHFGPATPTGSATLVNTRDAAGNVTAGKFTLSASVAGANCNLEFDRLGDGAAIGVGQYTVESGVGNATPGGIVYPTLGEEIDLPPPNGSARCSGAGCDNSAFVLSIVDAEHVVGYWMGTVDSDSGLGQAAVACSFYLPWAQYQP